MTGRLVLLAYSPQTRHLALRQAQVWRVRVDATPCSLANPRLPLLSTDQNGWVLPNHSRLRAKWNAAATPLTKPKTQVRRGETICTLLPHKGARHKVECQRSSDTYEAAPLTQAYLSFSGSRALVQRQASRPVARHYFRGTSLGPWGASPAAHETYMHVQPFDCLLGSRAPPIGTGKNPDLNPKQPQGR
jgi:hypothetical protein